MRSQSGQRPLKLSTMTPLHDNFDTIELIIKIITAVIGIFVFWKGTVEYRQNTRTKQAEFLEKLIAGFSAKEMQMAIRILDGYTYQHEGEDWKLTGQHKEGPASLVHVLRDHRVEPVAQPEEIAIRDSFCALLDYFSKLNYYLHNQLINKDELLYFRYYIDNAMKNEAVLNYIRFYYFTDTDFDELFAEIGKL